MEIPSALYKDKDSKLITQFTNSLWSTQVNQGQVVIYVSDIKIGPNAKDPKF